MANKPAGLNSKQLFFREMVLGTLVYAVVLGFFADYTSYLHTTSYSTTFLVAVVMQILTYLTFALKAWVAGLFKDNTSPVGKIGMLLGVWFVLFSSKFVFLAAIDVIFGSAVDVSGFVGLLVMIITMTVVKQLIDLVFKKLGD
jgi:hypothetical protein